MTTASVQAVQRKSVAAMFNTVNFVRGLGYDPAEHDGLREAADVMLGMHVRKYLTGSGDFYISQYRERLTGTKAELDALGRYTGDYFKTEPAVSEPLACVMLCGADIDIPARVYDWKSPVAREAKALFLECKAVDLDKPETLKPLSRDARILSLFRIHGKFESFCGMLDEKPEELAQFQPDEVGSIKTSRTIDPGESRLAAEICSMREKLVSSWPGQIQRLRIS